MLCLWLWLRLAFCVVLLTCAMCQMTKPDSGIDTGTHIAAGQGLELAPNVFGIKHELGNVLQFGDTISRAVDEVIAKMPAAAREEAQSVRKETGRVLKDCEQHLTSYASIDVYTECARTQLQTAMQQLDEIRSRYWATSGAAALRPQMFFM